MALTTLELAVDARLPRPATHMVVIGLARLCEAEQRVTEPITVSELARRIGLDRRTVQRQLPWLMSAGWLSRTPCADLFDGHVYTLHLERAA